MTRAGHEHGPRVGAGTAPSTRARRSAALGSLLLVAALLAPAGGGIAAAQTTERLTLAPHYEPQSVDSPEPVQNGRLGWLGIANAGDLDGDGRHDLLVPQYNAPGQIFVFSGATGALLYTLRLPAEDVPERGGNFVYPASLPDLGSCPDGQAAEVCPAAVGPADGVREILVGASGVAVGGVPSLGRAYVFDGATGALLKKTQMPPEDVESEARNFPEGKGFSFGRAVATLASPFQLDAPESVQLGDADGGGVGDFAVSNPTFYEEGPAMNPTCAPGPCVGSGRVYVFRGEDVAGSDPTVILDAPLHVIKNPKAVTTTEHQRFGHAIYPVGDLGHCPTDPGTDEACPEPTGDGDGRADLVIAAHRAEAVEGMPTGIVWAADGATGSIARRFDPPHPQPEALFGYGSGTMPVAAVGDVTGSTHPDVYVPAVVQDGEFAGQGRGYVFNGNLGAGRRGLLSLADDPTPSQGGNFGAPFTGIGDVHGDPRNEILIGAHGPWIPGGGPTIGDAHVYSPASGEIVLTLSDPEDEPGNGFGMGVASLGDLNDDGHMDFAVSAGSASTEDDSVLGAGRLFIFRSAEAPEPDPDPDPDPDPSPDPGTGPEGAVRLAGADRFQTAAAVSRDRFEDGAAPAAVVARADEAADALASGPFAAAVGGPVLLTTGEALHPVTGTELERAVAPDGVVYVVGGPGAVSEEVEQAIRGLGFTTRRMFGPSRVETAIAIARALGNPEGQLITTGFDFPDALTAGAAAARVNGVVLLTTPEQPHPSLDAYLAERPSTQRFAIGGPAARAYPSAKSVFGPTRDDTAVAVANEFFSGPETVGLARRDDFPDALTGAAHVAGAGGPILLTATAGPLEVTAGYLCANAATIRTAYVYGGSAVVSDQALAEIDARIQGQGC